MSDKFNVTELHPIATAAIRQSKNNDEIVKEVKNEVGIDIKIVPEETKLTMVTTQLLTLLKLKTGIRRHRWWFN